MTNQKPTLISYIIVVTLALTVGTLFSSGCASMKTFFGQDQSDEPSKPIQNPFGYQNHEDDPKTVVLRSKKGNQSFEVELPETDDNHTDLTVPFNGNSLRSTETSNSPIDYSYLKTKPSLTDRLIAGTFPQGSEENRAAQHEIESELGLTPSEGRLPNADESYLAAIDHVKQLYRTKRYEAGLLEIDKLVRLYPTSPKLYEMRGTLLDKLGYRDLAERAWQESLELNPENQSLRRFLDRRKRSRTLSGRAE